MARLLIAGYGFLGEALRLKFAAEGWKIDSLSRRGCRYSLPCDLSDTSSVAALEGEYDLIIHCAATRGGGPDAYRSVYLDGCRNLLKRFSDTPFVFTSSTSVYGQTDHTEVSELSAASPAAETSGVLRQAEDFVLASGGSVIRLSALCGPGRCHTLKSFLAGAARVDGNGERLLNFVHRGDVAQACFLLATDWGQAHGQIYNVSAMTLSQMECFQLLSERYKKALPDVAKLGEASRRRGNTSKRIVSDKIRAIGWQPSYPDFISLALSSE